MSKKQKTIRIVVNSVLLAVLIAFGVTIYQSGIESRQQQEQAQQELREKEQAQADARKEKKEAKEKAKEEKTKKEEAPEEEMVDAGTANVEADMADDTEFDSSAEELAEVEEPAAESIVEAPAEEPAAAAIPNLNFTEDTLMVWPLSGDVLLDYSMDQTIYHPTLDVYKYNPGIAIAAAVDSPVLAAASGTVTSIQEDAETGTTLTLDMGNGYQAVYGQLQNVTVAEGQTIGESTILGYVAQPTKYYSVEGSNLYFAMTRDGQALDPISYLP